MQNIVVDTEESGQRAIELLKANNSGRATFLPVSVIKGRMLSPEPRGEDGYLGTALSLVSSDEKFDEIFKNLLGRTCIAENLDVAVRISRKYKAQFRIVTLDGQVINAGGSMTGGSVANRAGILTRSNELVRLDTEIKKLIASEREAQEALQTAARELASAIYELEVAEDELQKADEALREFEAELSKLRQHLTGIESRINAANEEKKRIEHAGEETKQKIAQVKQEQEELDESYLELRLLQEKLKAQESSFDEEENRLSKQQSERSAEKSALDAEDEAAAQTIISLKRLFDEIKSDADARSRGIGQAEETGRDMESRLLEREGLILELSVKAKDFSAAISEANAKKLELEGERNTLDKHSQETNRELLDAERTVLRLEQKILENDLNERQILDRLWDTYELSHTSAMKLVDEKQNTAEANRRLAELRKEISALGTPNIGAIEEFERVNERYEFLSDQRSDIEKSKAELLKLLSEITGEMREIFTVAFKEINESFRVTFTELFGGGSAALTLEDEEDILQSGIEIRVQPPGKQLRSISLLSGGEKAFVAIALYFAIIKIKPTPFCVMDEIETALDEENVIRFAEYMRNMSNKTQFIVITHRRRTMEIADMLYGVTMQEKGVSQIISVDLTAAEKTIA
jgi:chromosome segregation protein